MPVSVGGSSRGFGFYIRTLCFLDERFLMLVIDLRLNTGFFQWGHYYGFYKGLSIVFFGCRIPALPSSALSGNMEGTACLLYPGRFGY